MPLHQAKVSLKVNKINNAMFKMCLKVLNIAPEYNNEM